MRKQTFKEESNHTDCEKPGFIVNILILMIKSKCQETKGNTL